MALFSDQGHLARPVTMKSFFCLVLVFASVIYGNVKRVNEIIRKNGLADHLILGVNQTANKSELKRAYFKLSMELHPDKLKQSFTPKQIAKSGWCEQALHCGSEAFKIMSSAYERMLARIERQEAQALARAQFLREEAARKKRERELYKKRMEEERLQREREQKLREEQERRERDLHAFRLARQAEINLQNRRLQAERMRKAEENRTAEQRKIDEARRKREQAEYERKRKQEQQDLIFAEQNMQSMLKQHEKNEAMLKAAAEAQRKEAFEAKLANDPEFRAQHEAKLAEEEAKRVEEEKYKAYSEDLIMRQKMMIRSSQKTKALLRRAWLQDLRAQGLTPVINKTPKTPKEHQVYRVEKRKRSESSEDEADDSVYEWNMAYSDYKDMRTARKKARRESLLEEYI